MTTLKHRRAVPLKFRALLQQEINSKCPFCDSTEVDHFHVHHINEDPSDNDFGNLLMTCTTCHSKITKGDILQPEVFRKKMSLRNRSPSNIAPISNRQNRISGSVINSVIGDNNKITYKVGNVSEKYPPGCLGHDTLKANYISYLVGRYNDFKKDELGSRMNYAVFASILKKHFKLGPTRSIYNLPIERFTDVSDFIQVRIEGTRLARVKRAKGQVNFYSSFEDYCEQNELKVP